MNVKHPAVFLDRDGTLNVDCSYLTKPEQLQLLPGVGPALVRLRRAGYVCVIVTNQSAVGRGWMSEEDLQRVHEEMKRQLGAHEACVDAIYHCPHHVDHPERKPAPGMLLRAAAELQLDLAASWMIGDSLRDMQAGQGAGCRGCILVRTGNPIDGANLSLPEPVHVVDDLNAAVDLILASRAA
ncbi:MAG TPA: HAD family hydrolase [Gemmataceae bacterium]|nr:HAD family hydrolase [Gemmataceae bacterium]